MNIFEHSNYRDLLKAWLLHSKDDGEAVTGARLAEDIAMSRPAFSKASSGETQFTSDQAFLLSQRLGFSEEEADYFQLLVEIERTALEARKESLTTRRLALQKQHVSTPQEIGTSEAVFINEADKQAYFASPWAPLVHVFFTIPKYQGNPALLTEQLGIPSNELSSLISLLVRMKLLKEFEKGKWVTTDASIHSREYSALTTAQQMLGRAISMNRLSLIPLKERYGLSVTFSSDEKTYELSRQILVRAVAEMHALITDSAAEKVFQLSIDLFSWERK